MFINIGSPSNNLRIVQYDILRGNCSEETPHYT